MKPFNLFILKSQSDKNEDNNKNIGHQITKDYLNSGPGFSNRPENRKLDRRMVRKIEGTFFFLAKTAKRNHFE